MAEPTKLKVGISVDGIAPCEIQDENGEITVIPEFNLVRFELAKPEYPMLGKAMEMGVNLLEALPETPLIAVGYNIRYRSDQPEPTFLALTATPLESKLAGQEKVVRTENKHSMSYEEGLLNLLISEAKDSCSVQLNFHKDSENCEDLISWLKRPIGDIQRRVDSMLESLDLDVKTGDS